MSAADDIKKAWTRPGVNPTYHRQEQAHLRRRWPVLAEAIEKLVPETPSSVGITEEDTRQHQVADLLLEHRRLTIGPCACGWFDLGRSHADHVAKEIMKVIG